MLLAASNELTDGQKEKKRTQNSQTRKTEEALTQTTHETPTEHNVLIEAKNGVKYYNYSKKK